MAVSYLIRQHFSSFTIIAATLLARRLERVREEAEIRARDIVITAIQPSAW